LPKEWLDETATRRGYVVSDAALLPRVALIDLWLVRTVGALVTVIGVVLISAARRRRVTDEIVLLGLGSAVALSGIHLIYVLSGVISEIYLADAAAEIGPAALWGIGRLRGQVA